MSQASKKYFPVQEALLLCGGRVLEDAWLSTFVSPESVQELQRWDKTNYQVDITKLGRKRAKKKITCFLKKYLLVFGGQVAT